MKGRRLLIVNGDEFGRSSGINQGILEAHTRGVLTSASAMVRRPAAEAAAALARAHPTLSVGLHVDLCEWTVRDGAWVVVERVVPLDDHPAVEREVRRQVEAFRTLYGRDPSHLDSHQNVHRSGPVLRVLATMARELSVPLRHFTPGLFVCSEFHGQTSRGLPYPEGVSVERLLAVLQALPPGVSELICHPGRGVVDGGMYGEERERELETLLDPRVEQALKTQGIVLQSFDQLASSGVLPDGNFREMESSFRDRGRAAFRRGEYVRARRWFERAVVVGGDRPWPWLWLARSQLQTGDVEGSRDSIQEALGQVPGWPPGLLHLADLHLQAERWEEAGQILIGLASRNGEGSGELASGVAQRIRRMEDPIRALQVAETLAAHRPEEECALAARAIARWRLGDPAEARRSLEPVLRHPKGVGIRAAAEFHLEVGEPQVAWSLLRDCGPGGKAHARLVSRVAQGLRKSGRLTLAWEAFDEAISGGGGTPSNRHWRKVVVGEVQVLSGVAAPALPRLPHYRAMPHRVLHLVGKSLPHLQTGYSVRTRYVTQSQRDAGLDPHVVTQLGFPWTVGVQEAPLWESVEGIPHHRLMPKGPLSPRLDRRLDANAEALIELVRRVRPAALHAASDYRNALLALAVGRACGIPVVYEVRGFWEDTWSSKQAGNGAEDSVAYQWRRERELECMRQADRVVTLAEVMREEMAARGVDREKVRVIPNAVDPAAFEPVGREPGLAGRLGIGGDEVVVGYVSSFVAYEGIRFLIEAVAQLASRGLPVRGLLVGDGEEREALESRARELGMEDRILFTGRVPHEEVARYYGLIDVFVVPRTDDRVCHLVTPLKPYEAMAMERAVVVSGVRALGEMVVPGKTGLVFRPEDPQDLANVLDPLVRCPERRRSLGRAARAWVSRHRTWAQNGQRYADLYRDLEVLPPETSLRGREGPEPAGLAPRTLRTRVAPTPLTTGRNQR
jgi:PEP-CTERM/exosortase A-associated glycosyltransferase